MPNASCISVSRPNRSLTCLDQNHLSQIFTASSPSPMEAQLFPPPPGRGIAGGEVHHDTADVLRLGGGAGESGRRRFPPFTRTFFRRRPRRSADRNKLCHFRGARAGSVRRSAAERARSEGRFGAPAGPCSRWFPGLATRRSSCPHLSAPS